MQKELPWQVKMFQKTLKKKLRLKELKKYLGSIPADKQCLLVTCGDNNGAMNYYLREIGGNWRWADLEKTGLGEMSELLGDEVKLAQSDYIPFPDSHFDYAISIDVHEHMQDPQSFTRELWRVTRNNGQVLITVPGGDNRKLVNKLKHRIGMTKEKYGHTRDGYTAAEIKALMAETGIEARSTSTFSRFFTEMIELGINFLYVNILSKKSTTNVKEGTIAPQTREQVKSVEKTYRLYSMVYPFFWIISQLDKLVFFTEGYVVVVQGEKRKE